MRSALLVALLPVALGLILLSSTVEDDAYITYWPAHTLARHGEITNYNGDRVEQSSSLAFVVILAALSRVAPLEIPTLAPIVSLACAVGVVLLVRKLAASVNEQLAAGASLLAATWSGLLVWGASGMETTLQTVAAAAFVLLLGRALDERWRSSSWVGLALVTLLFQTVRPEALYLSAVVLGAYALVATGRRQSTGEDAPSGPRSRRLVGALTLTLTAAALVALFRLSYFGDLLPQPAAAKLSGISLPSLEAGSSYLLRHALLRVDGAVWALAAAAAGVLALRILRGREQRPMIGALLSFSAVHVGFVVLSGGDWIPQGRFLLPVLPMASVLAVWLLEEALGSRRRRVAVALLVTLQLLGALHFARTDSPGAPLWAAARVAGPASDGNFFERRNRDLHHDRVLADRLIELVESLEAAGHPETVVLSGQMGLVAYYTARATTGAAETDQHGRVRFVDRWGLSTRDFTQCAVTTDRRRFPMGIHVPYHLVFDHLAALERDCGIPRPDIVWDWTSEIGDREALLRNGYRVFYEQDGAVRNGSSLLPGRDVRARELIAVRAALLREGELAPRFVSFER